MKLDRSSQGSNSKQQAEGPLLGCTHLKVHDLRYRENEDDDIFNNTENRTADPNCCQTHALALCLRGPESVDRSALEADCQGIGYGMQGEENNTKIAGYRKPSLCKYSQVKQEN